MLRSRCRLASPRPSPSYPPMVLHHGGPRRLVTLAIETSCDDTAVAILERKGEERSGGPRTRLLFNERVSSDNRAFRGIYPLQTIRSHNAELALLVRKALHHIPEGANPEPGTGDTGAAGRSVSDRTSRRVPDFVSVTRGPGITSNLGVGLNTAKGLAVAWGVPLVGVHHMQAHALTPRLVRAIGMKMAGEERQVDGTHGAQKKGGPDFPFLSLLVSGGHTQLVHSVSLTDHRIVATTADTAIGNMLDQTARVILPESVIERSEDVMYGRLMESFAFGDSEDQPSHQGRGRKNPYDFFTPLPSRGAELHDVPTGYDWTIPHPLSRTRKLAYSFSSIHSHVHALAASRPDMSIVERRALARHTMRVAFQHLAGRLCLALGDVPDLSRGVSTLVVAGGVASNRFLMHVLRTTLAARGYGNIDVVAPPVELCTDNAAMIAWAGMEMYEAGYCSDLSVLPIGKWPMDPSVGAGILGVGGWLRRDGF